MEKKQKSRGLGRGLSALMADVNLDAPAPDGPLRPERSVPIEDVVPNPGQPRRQFDEHALNDLAASIRAKGILQPLIVRPNPEEGAAWQIVAGERRWRAAQRAQLHSVPVIVRELDDTEVLEVAIVENIQRADLNPVEEARGYRQLIEAFGHTQEQLSLSLGRSRSHIANALRLLTLPADVQEHLSAGRLTAGHARALVTTDNASELARQVIAKGLSVRETERLSRQVTGKPAQAARKAAARPQKDSDTRALEQDLAANLRMSVSINHKDVSGAGEMVIRYQDLDQLDTLCRMLSAMLPDETR
jgi:ParB family chromosome partitioning protein